MIYAVSIKDSSVTFDPVTEAHTWMIAALTRACGTCNVALVVSCAREAHGVGDPHTRGQAVDVSVHNLSAPMIVRVREYLMQLLGPGWTVLFETPDAIDATKEPQLVQIATINRGATARHLHIQPVKGTTFPATPPVVVGKVA